MVFAWFVSVCLAGPASAFGVRSGDPLPEIPLTLDHRNTAPPLAVSDLPGRRYLAFWASWCKPCLAELNEIQALMASGDYAEVTFVAINVDEVPARAAPALQRTSYQGPSYFLADAALADAIRTEGIPRSIAVDAQGVVSLDGRGWGTGTVRSHLSQAQGIEARRARKAAKEAP